MESTSPPESASPPDGDTRDGDPPARGGGRRRAVDQALLIAVLSVISSLLGAVVGGLVTAYAARSSVDAQRDSTRLQVEADRAIQLREARGAAYESFLNAIADVHSAYTKTHSCASDPRQDPILISRSPGPTDESAYLRIGTSVLSARDHAACTAAAERYTQERLRAEKAFNAVYQWGSRDTTVAGERLMLILPDLHCPTFGVAARRCVYGMPITDWMHNLVYPTGDPWPADVGRADEAEVHSLAMLLVVRDSIQYDALHTSLLGAFRGAGCHDLSTDPGAAAC